MQRTYQFGAIEVDAVQRTVRVDHQPASLGGRAFDLLLVLLENAGSLVTKDQRRARPASGTRPARTPWTATRSRRAARTAR